MEHEFELRGKKGMRGKTAKTQTQAVLQWGAPQDITA
jgi:hypothetical protein